MACKRGGEDKDFASKIWDGYELYGEINIGVLLERCLITISKNRLHMHGLIEKMCKKIVQEQHDKKPSKWSRLWNPDDIYCAFVSGEGMENVETISLDLSRSEEKWFSTKIFAQMKKMFAKMKKLRLLKVYYSLGDEHKMSLPKDFEFPPNLNYLHWEGLVSLPSKFHGEKLVAINLKSSNIEELLKGEKCFPELKFIDLSNSQWLIKIPKFSRMPNLEKLNLEGCVSFSKLHSSIGTFSEMKFLTELNFSESGIRELPSSIGSLISLETLNLSKCSKFEKFPDILFVNMRHLKRLELSDSGIKELPTSILQLESLEFCYLDGCSNLEIFPEIMEDMEHSKGLSLRKKRLGMLNLGNCKNLETIPNIIGNLTCFRQLFVFNCPKLHKLPDSLRSMQLKQLDVSGCNLMAGAIPDDLWCLFSLEVLDVSGNNIDCIPGGIIRLSRLRVLFMYDCLMLKEIPELPSSLRRIGAHGCPLLETLSSDAKHPLWSSLHNCLKSHIQEVPPCTTYGKCHHVQVVIPGSRGIPEWISHKSMGHEITIDLPKNWYEDSNFLGFALFRHLVPFDYDDYVHAGNGTLRLLISDGDQFGHVETIQFIPSCIDTLIADPALMAVYFPQIAISSKYRSNRWNKFKAGFSALAYLAKSLFKVKSCGIHLIYDHGQDHPQQSLQLFNVKRSHDDTEDHPHV
ncbi:disease resistance protein RUN1-like isoform X2 [Vitis riparia]|uniref:disease resistance protein RUN1-like isoform X2 n=1 Tax=Vitis riparia TaxID=96939 RepID=UPI00155A69C4|nr:disease resistance protein RUN1-like isoform X2 [Vitis riparia]